MKKLIDFDNYMIEIEVKDDNEYAMDFKVVEINGRGQNPETQEWDIPLYGDGIHSEDFEHGDEVCHGFIKWDGCSHWYFSEYQHLCGLNSLENFGQLPKKIFDLAAEFMPRFNIDVAS